MHESDDVTHRVAIDGNYSGRPPDFDWPAMSPLKEFSFCSSVVGVIGGWGMATTQYDIWRTARELIEAHCGKAALHAACLAEASQAQGDVENFLVWRRVLAEIDKLRGTESAGLIRK